MDPAAARREMIKQAKLKICNQIQLQENLGILACAMCISIGKNTVSGQNVEAPSSPTMSLKFGNAIATNVVNIT